MLQSKKELDRVTSEITQELLAYDTSTPITEDYYKDILAKLPDYAQDKVNLDKILSEQDKLYQKILLFSCYQYAAHNSWMSYEEVHSAINGDPMSTLNERQGCNQELEELNQLNENIATLTIEEFEKQMELEEKFKNLAVGDEDSSNDESSDSNLLTFNETDPSSTETNTTVVFAASIIKLSAKLKVAEEEAERKAKEEAVLRQEKLEAERKLKELEDQQAILAQQKYEEEAKLAEEKLADERRVEEEARKQDEEEARIEQARLEAGEVQQKQNNTTITQEEAQARVEPQQQAQTQQPQPMQDDVIEEAAQQDLQNQQQAVNQQRVTERKQKNEEIAGIAEKIEGDSKQIRKMNDQYSNEPGDSSLAIGNKVNKMKNDEEHHEKLANKLENLLSELPHNLENIGEEERKMILVARDLLEQAFKFVKENIQVGKSNVTNLEEQQENKHLEEQEESRLEESYQRRLAKDKDLQEQQTRRKKREAEARKRAEEEKKRKLNISPAKARKAAKKKAKEEAAKKRNPRNTSS